MLNERLILVFEPFLTFTLCVVIDGNINSCPVFTANHQEGEFQILNSFIFYFTGGELILLSLCSLKLET